MYWQCIVIHTVQGSCVRRSWISAGAVPLLRKHQRTVLRVAQNPFCLVGYTCGEASWGMACTRNSHLPSNFLHRRASPPDKVMCRWCLLKPAAPGGLGHYAVLQCNPASCQCSIEQDRRGLEPWRVECLSAPAVRTGYAVAVHQRAQSQIK